MRPTTYRATFVGNLGLVILGLPLSAFAIYIGLTQPEVVLVMIGVLILAALLAMRLRLRVIVDDEHLEYRGLFRTTRIAIADIVDVQRMVDLGGPADRYYGPLTFRFRTACDEVKINFKFFPSGCMRDVMCSIKRTQELTRARTCRS